MITLHVKKYWWQKWDFYGGQGQKMSRRRYLYNSCNNDEAFFVLLFTDRKKKCVNIKNQIERTTLCLLTLLHNQCEKIEKSALGEYFS